MQTILKVVRDNRGQANMVDNYIAAFCERFADESPLSMFPTEHADVAFARDDAHDLLVSSRDQSAASLGSFCASLHQTNDKVRFVFVNPVIVSYRSNGQKLRLWVGSPSLGKAGSTETE
jgi:hypothetical protein